MNSLINPKEQITQDGQLHPLKVTSLLYLKEALRREEYEQCGSILEAAKEFVDQKDVQTLIQEHIAFLKARDRKIVRNFRKP